MPARARIRSSDVVTSRRLGRDRREIAVDAPVQRPGAADPRRVSAEAELADRDPRGHRLYSVDALRGWAIVILLLAGNPFMREHLPVQFKHPEWHGLHFADIFFPVFLFVVGISMTLSRRTGSFGRVLRRAGTLFAIGVALSSIKHGRLYLPGVLQHIAGAYLLAWVVLRAPRKLHLALTGAIFGTVWAAFLLWPGADGDPWDMHSTVSHTVDGWLFGHFATEGVMPTVMSSVTVLGGAIVGRAARSRDDPVRRLLWVIGVSVLLVAAGTLMATIVPINKRVWSPSFTLVTLGVACAWFALFIWLVDVLKGRRWVPLLVELGANPIAIYVAYITIRAVLSRYRDAAPVIAPFGSEAAGALTYSLLWLFAGWLFARFLYRRGVFLRI